MKQSIDTFASQLDAAAKMAKATHQIAKENAISLTDAYAIQQASIDKRIERGEKLIGFKLGFTSKAKMEQMGVDEIIFGRLTDAMQIKNEGNLNLQNYIHPRVEPEIAFLLSKDIEGEIELSEVNTYIDKVGIALEIIDSRFENFKFSLEDVVADNCSSTGFVIADWLPNDTFINNVGISLNIDGAAQQNGNTNAILGNPLESLVEVSKMAKKYNAQLTKGSIILAGAATSAVFLKSKNNVEASFEGLGSVKFNVL